MTAAKQQSIIASVKRFDEFHHPSGETLLEKEHAYRLEVVEILLKTGVALLKIEHFRTLLERNST